MSYAIPTHFRNINISALRIPSTEASLKYSWSLWVGPWDSLKNLQYFSLAFVKVEHSWKRSNSLAIYMAAAFFFDVSETNDWNVSYKLNLIIDTALNFAIKTRLTWNSLSRISWIHNGTPIMRFCILASVKNKSNI